MIFPWSQAHRRRELLAAPFPAPWLWYVRANVPSYDLLPADLRQRLLDATRVIVAEKNWEGCGGLMLTDEIKVTIAGQAARLVLGFEDDYFPNVETILVYPRGFLVTTYRHVAGGVIEESAVPYAGEAALRGPVVVSWADARAGGAEPGDGRNVVLHEFAHKLDMRDGAADGVPYLRDRAQVETWSRVMRAEYARLVAQTEAGEPSLLDPYGATSPAEFFAVATECFFERPLQMCGEHPLLYAVLRDFYRQDPAALVPDIGNQR